MLNAFAFSNFLYYNLIIAFCNLMGNIMKEEPVFKSEYNFLDGIKNYIYVLVFPFLFVLPFIILLMVISGVLSIDYFELRNSLIITFLNLIFSYLVFIGVLFYYHRKHKINIIKASKFSFKNINWPKMLAVVIIGAISVYCLAPFVNVIDHLFTFIGYSPSNEIPFLMDTFPKFLLGLTALAIFPAIVEEFIFRGIIFNGFLNKLKPFAAIMLTALLFTLFHGGLQQTIYQFILGVILTTVAYITGNIIYCIVIHFINNFIVVLYTYLNLNSEIVFNNAFNYIWPILLAAAGLLVIAFIIYLKYCY